MISNDSRRSQSFSFWLKSLFGGTIALIAAGGSMVAILDYFQVKPGPHNQGNMAIIITATQEIRSVQQTAELTNSPTITIQPTSTIPPTATIQPTTTSTPTPLPRPDAIEFVLSYWQNVSEHSYDLAWTQLSPNFRRDVHNNSYESYVQGYQKMNLCHIEVSNSSVLQQNDLVAVVTAHFVYYTGPQCKPGDHDFEMVLTYDQASNSWLFDKNSVRR